MCRKLIFIRMFFLLMSNDSKQEVNLISVAPQFQLSGARDENYNTSTLECAFKKWFKEVDRRNVS